MTDEEKKVVEEKTREKYFYIDKEKTCQVLTGIATSFIGAGLALVVFAALHKPPVPPCPFQYNNPRPCPMKMMDWGMRPDKRFIPGSHFRNHRGFGGPREFRGPRGFGGPERFQNSGFPKGKLMPPPPQINNEGPKLPPQNANTTPKR